MSKAIIKSQTSVKLYFDRPSSEKHRVLDEVVYSIMVHGARIWYGVFRTGF